MANAMPRLTDFFKVRTWSGRSAVVETLITLAKQIPADGEGAEHLIEVRVNGAASRDDAKQIAETIAGSNLVKTCVTGNDPNWGGLRQPLGTRGFLLRSLVFVCF